MHRESLETSRSDAVIINSQPVPIRRRWSRFSLRMMLVVITVLCVWLGLKVNAARRQRTAVAAILGDRGRIIFDYQMVPIAGEPDTFDVDANSLPPGPAWLRQLFGDDCFRNVVSVVFLGGRIAQSELELMRNCRS